MNLDPRKLVLLKTIAECGSITAAAGSLGYTVSAVSQQVRALEKAAGTRLIERMPRGVQLTAAGDVLVRHAGDITRSLAAAAGDLEDLSALRAGHVRLAVFPTAGASLLPLAVKRLHAEHPGVSIEVVSERLAGILAGLSSRAVDLGLVWSYDWTDLDRSQLHLDHLLEDETQLIVGAAHPLAGRRVVNVGELASEEWIIRADRHPVSELLHRICEANGFVPRVAFAANDYQEAQAMAAVGIGIAIAPRLGLSGIREDVRVLSMEGTGVPIRQVWAARLRNRSMSPASNAMLSTLHAVARTLRSSQRDDLHAS